MKFLDSLYNVKSKNNDPVLSFDIELNPACFIYQVHFPGYPVTPGVCLIAMVLELLEMNQAESFKISKIVKAKFLNVVDPRDVTVLKCSYRKIENLPDGTLRVSADIVGENVIYARVSLILTNA